MSQIDRAAAQIASTATQDHVSSKQWRRNRRRDGHYQRNQERLPPDPNKYADHVHIHVNSRWFKDADETVWRDMYGRVAKKVFDKKSVDYNFALCGHGEGAVRPTRPKGHVILYLLRDDSMTSYTYKSIIEEETFGPVCENCLEEMKNFKNHRVLRALGGPVSR